MNLTRENKLDVWSGVAAIVGVALTLAASELSRPLLMGIGVGIVMVTAIIRISYFRGSTRPTKPHP
jgi:hypothetical protein